MGKKYTYVVVQLTTTQVQMLHTFGQHLASKLNLKCYLQFKHLYTPYTRHFRFNTTLATHSCAPLRTQRTPKRSQCTQQRTHVWLKKIDDKDQTWASHNLFLSLSTNNVILTPH